MSIETKVIETVEKLNNLEWVVAPEPKLQRDYPKQLYYAMPAQAGEIIRDTMDDITRVRLAFSYRDVKQMIEQLREAELEGNLALPNDEVIMEFSISAQSQYLNGLCTPSRNIITGL